MEIVDITLLGIDVTAIMLIIFTANFIAKEFSTGTIHFFSNYSFTSKVFCGETVTYSQVINSI